MESLTQEAIEARIEKHRMGTVAFRAFDSEGKPLPNAILDIEQTSHRFLFGCNLFMWRDDDSEWQASYRERFRNLLNYATLGFYWWSYESVRGRPNHDYVDRVLDWTESVGIACKGHPLVWNHSAGAWYPRDRVELRRLSDERVRDCVSRFHGRIGRWDAVNEATDPFRGGTFENVFSDAWRDAGRVEFTRHCFHVAREANPKATLLINDYRLDGAYETLVEQLVDERGARLYDAIGLQTHQHGGVMPAERLWEVCERFGRFGVPLHFTETTILSGARTSDGFEATNPTGEERQAEAVERFYTVLFSHPSVEAITWWDFSDRGAWQRAPAGFLRADGSPKPVYDRLTALIKGKWWTRETRRTDADGRAEVRGFFGDYAVTLRGENGTATRRRFRLGPGGPTLIEVAVGHGAR